jgi:hypothetical protein
MHPISRAFKGIEERLSDQAGPDCNRLKSMLSPPPTRKIEHLTPAVVLVAGRFVDHQPFKTLSGLLSVSVISRQFVHDELSTSDIASADKRIEGFNPQERA